MSSKRNWVFVTGGLTVGGIVGIAFGMPMIFGLDIDQRWGLLVAVAYLIIFLGVGLAVSLLLIRIKSTQESLKLQVKRNTDNQETFGQYVNEQGSRDKNTKALEGDLESAREVITKLECKLDLATGKPNGALGIPNPFRVCVVGETVNDGLIKLKLRSFFNKYGLKASEWDIEFVDNAKLRKFDVLRRLKKGQSRFNLGVIGQLHHHSNRKDDKQNLLTKLNEETYIDCVVGSHPQNPLTVDDIITKLDDYLYETFCKKD